MYTHTYIHTEGDESSASASEHREREREKNGAKGAAIRAPGRRRRRTNKSARPILCGGRNIHIYICACISQGGVLCYTSFLAAAAAADLINKPRSASMKLHFRIFHLLMRARARAA